MTDIFHQWGSDLNLGPTGDLLTVSGAMQGRQRILRRLLTNPGDYIWQLDYGAGLAAFIGRPANVRRIEALIRSQMFKEAATARSPGPVINVIASSGGTGGSVYANIRYVDAGAGETQMLDVAIGG